MIGHQVEGFLTFILSKDWIESEIRSMIREGVNVKPVAPGFKVGVDFSSPNIAKEMHVGHLRSTIIGDSISRILEFYGYEVYRINHLGDWGTQFGMLIEYMYKIYPNFLYNMPKISDLTKFYKDAKQLMDNDDEFRKKSRSRVVKLQSGDEISRIAWKKICDLSIEEFNKMYKRLDIKLDHCGESFYNDLIPDVVNELQNKGIITESNGALVIFTTISPAPLIVIKSDGGYGYDTTDLACLKYRTQVLKLKWIIYVTDIGQTEHFMKIFNVGEKSGMFHINPMMYKYRKSTHNVQSNPPEITTLFSPLTPLFVLQTASPLEVFPLAVGASSIYLSLRFPEISYGCL